MGTADADTAGSFGSFASTDSLVNGINEIDFASPSNPAVNFSVEAWVNGPAQSVDGGIITKGYGGSEQFNLDTGGKTACPNVLWRVGNQAVLYWFEFLKKA